jgi:hypothetical protein
VLDALVQSRRDRRAAERLLRKLIRKQARTPRVLITDKLRSCGAARADMSMKFEYRQHKGLNNRAENSHQPTRRRERIMKRFKSARHLQRFVSIHDVIATLFHFPRHSLSAIQYRTLRTEAMIAWKELAGMHAIAASKSRQRDRATSERSNWWIVSPPSAWAMAGTGKTMATIGSADFEHPCQAFTFAAGHSFLCVGRSI